MLSLGSKLILALIGGILGGIGGWLAARGSHPHRAD